MNFNDNLRRAGFMLRYGAYGLMEWATAYAPTDIAEVPASADRLQIKWMEQLLCAGTPGARITRIQVVGGSDGTNTRRALHIDYNAEGQAAKLPTDLFLKAATDVRTRLTNGASSRSESEVRFYQIYRPRLDIEAPKTRYAGYHVPSGRMMIIFDDLTKTGTKFLDPFHHVTRAQAEMMVDLIATYQAAFWNDAEFRRAPYVLSTLEFQRRANIAIPFASLSERGIKRAEAVMPAVLREMDPGRLWNLHMASLARLQTAPYVLTHYDMHIGNWYLTPDQRMGLTDWSMRYGHWSSDITYALTSALRIEDRRAWERDLLRRYREKLAERGVNDVPSEEQVWAEYRRQTFHPLYFWLVTIGAGVFQRDMQPDPISLANLERMSQAVVDLESVREMEAVA